jgi:hypothetical protein
VIEFARAVEARWPCPEGNRDEGRGLKPSSSGMMIQEDNRQEYIAAGEQQATDGNGAELLLFWAKEERQ